MYYIGQYDLTVTDNKIYFPLEIRDGEIEWCLVQPKNDNHTYLIVDYIKEVQELHLYNEIIRGKSPITQGIMVLPQSLYDFFSEETVCIGAGDMIEIWKKNEFDDYCKRMQNQFKDLMDISF